MSAKNTSVEQIPEAGQVDLVWSPAWTKDRMSMDWAEDKFSSGFVFNNPNEAACCGCGESFAVA